MVFNNPIAIGTNQGQIIIMDLYFDPVSFSC